MFLSVDDELQYVLSLLYSLPSLSRTLLYVAACIGLSLLASKLLFYRKHKGKVPGPAYVAPLVGGLIDMIRNPYLFWEKQRMYNPGGVSWNSILGKYMMFSANAEMSHKIFTINAADTLTLALHPNAKILLGNQNIAFLTGKEHKDLRKSFLHLFNVKALGVYLLTQERVIRKHLDLWLEEYPLGKKPVEMRECLRQLSAETSQSVFVGPYLKDPASFSRDFLTLTQGFLSAPIYFPGTGLYRAHKARIRIVDVLAEAVREAKIHISHGHAPRCLLEFWTEEIQRECQEAEAEGRALPSHADNRKMADTVMDFLFASQDATTAGTAWIVAMMADHPEILEKVREEQRILRPNNEHITQELLQEMTYAKQVILELLRYRPPAPMMPMLTHKDLEINNVHVPKDALLIASIWSSCMEGFPHPHTFDPDRMSEERHEDRVYQKQYIPFGVGPHRCVGYLYAINHLTLFLVSIASLHFVRTYTHDSNAVEYYPTLYPKNLLCTFAPICH